jgi:transcriptional regulator with XRE-family HTH domain
MAAPFATPRARALGFGLRRSREARRFGVRELARRAGVRPQELSSWESGKRVPKVEEVAVLLGVLDVGGEERERLFELARTVREPSWLERQVPGVAPEVWAYAEYEQRATAVFGWEPQLVPGLLQTDGYVRAILAGLGRPPGEVEKLVRVRRARRGVLGCPRPLGFRAVVAEEALRRGVAAPESMVEQLRHLITMSRRSNVGFRILPSGGSVHAGLYGQFAILDFADLPPIVLIEQYRTTAYLYADDQVADYRAAAGTLVDRALDERESCALIEGVIAELGGAV